MLAVIVLTNHPCSDLFVAFHFLVDFSRTFINHILATLMNQDQQKNCDNRCNYHVPNLSKCEKCDNLCNYHVPNLSKCENCDNLCRNEENLQKRGSESSEERREQEARTIIKTITIITIIIIMIIIIIIVIIIVIMIISKNDTGWSGGEDWRRDRTTSDA